MNKIKINNNRINKSAFLCFSIIIILLSFSCSRDKRDTNKLIIGSGGSLLLGNNNPVYIQRNSNAWETFTQLDENLEPQPMLAESWNSRNDGKIWILNLKKSVYFQNGDEFNAGIAVENILRMKNHPELDLYSVYSFLDTVFSLNNFQIELRFQYPVIDFPNKIGHYFAGIFSLKSFDKNGKIIQLIGCGPYELVDIKTGEYDRFKAFTGYYKGKPKFNEIEFRIIPDPVMRIMALIRGDIDMIAHMAGLSPYHLKYLRNFPEIRIDSFMAGITHYLVYNNSSTFFSQKHNRVHLDNLINREKIVNSILDNKGYIAQDYFIETKTGWSKNRFSRKSINDNAKFKKAGDRNLVLLLNQGEAINWDYKSISEYIYDLFSAENIKIDIIALEGEVYKKYLQSGKYDITFYPLSIPTGTPELFIRALIYSKGMQTRRSYSLTHFRSENIDSLFEQCLRASTLNEQQSIYNEILNILSEEKILLPLFHEKYYIAYNKRLKTIRVDPFLKPDLSSIQCED